MDNALERLAPRGPQGNPNPNWIVLMFLDASDLFWEGCVAQVVPSEQVGKEL